MAAKKSTTSKVSTKQPAAKAVQNAEASVAAPATPIVETRFSNVPPAAAAAKSITEAEVRSRAYFISISGEGGSEFDNWLRAESELRGL